MKNNSPMKAYYTLFISILIYACSGSNQEITQEENTPADEIPAEAKIEKALYDEVMVVHDEMMPRMDDMMRLKGMLIGRSDSLREAGIEEPTVALLKATESIDKANEAMMSWMRAFDREMTSLTHEERVVYLTEQKQKMDSVKLVIPVE